MKERVLGQELLQPLLGLVILAQLGDLVTFKAAAVIVLFLLVRRLGQRFPTYDAPAAWLAIGLGVVGLGSNVFFGILA